LQEEKLLQGKEPSIKMPFLDIFSKKKSLKKKQETKIKIVIDYREKNCLVASELISMGFEKSI